MKYKAEDGTTFNTEAEALDHEKKIEAEKQEKAEKERLERIKKENEVEEIFFVAAEDIN